MSVTHRYGVMGMTESPADLPLTRTPRGRPASYESDRVVRTIDDVEAYVAGICFKTGPPELVGAELEWTVHRGTEPHRPLDRHDLVTALDCHAPPTLRPGGPHRQLPAGSTVTVEPGGQVEISTLPYPSLARLHAATLADIRDLTRLLSRTGLVLGADGIDAHRPPRRMLHTPRYDAMAHAFAHHGTAGLTMMCSTASVQVCIDAGQPLRHAARWAAAHELGPVLLAVFANSSRHAGRDTGWASARMRAWLDMEPRHTGPVYRADATDPAVAWARYALRAPLLCLQRGGGSLRAPASLSFGEWLAGAMPRPPTVEDLELHLSTLFPPVRPRGYLEVRYLDAQPPGEWFAPIAVLVALLADDDTIDQARDLCAPVAGRWVAAARSGLADPAIAGAARSVLDLACRRLDRTDLSPAVRQEVTDIARRRLAATASSYNSR